MTYQEVINMLGYISSIVNVDGTFKNTKPSRLSLGTINDSWPLIACINIKSVVDFGKSNVKFNIAMVFLKQDTVDSGDSEQDSIVDDMFGLHNDFFECLNRDSENLEGPYYGKFNFGQVTGGPELQKRAGTVSGYGVQFTLTTKNDC